MEKIYYFASGNLSKAEELSKILDKKLLLPPNFDVEETGLTYLDNALLKAKAIFNMKRNNSNYIVLADDSGLEIEAMPNDLGLYTARFGGNNLSAKERYELVLERMKYTNNRKARFVCTLVLYFGNDCYISSQGIIDGEISNEARGSNGHGYDPIFYIPSLNCTLGELDIETKNKISHRAIACKQLKPFFN